MCDKDKENTKGVGDEETSGLRGEFVDEDGSDRKELEGDMDRDDLTEAWIETLKKKGREIPGDAEERLKREKREKKKVRKFKRPEGGKLYALDPENNTLVEIDESGGAVDKNKDDSDSEERD